MSNTETDIDEFAHGSAYLMNDDDVVGGRIKVPISRGGDPAVAVLSYPSTITISSSSLSF
jgi:hypothetical protein